MRRLYTTIAAQNRIHLGRKPRGTALAELPARDMLRSAACAFALIGCGTIEYGTSTLDGGTQPGTDIGAQSADATSTDDGSNPCLPRMKPPMPATWPYPPTKAAYQANFWDAFPDREGCSPSLCHGLVEGTGAPGNPPLIAGLLTDLDDPIALSDSIEQIWARSIPESKPGSPTPVAPLAWEHNAAGGNRPPTYTPDQLAFVHRFLELSQDCAWIALINAEGGSPPVCEAPPCACALPELASLQYCSE